MHSEEDFLFSVKISQLAVIHASLFNKIVYHCIHHKPLAVFMLSNLLKLQQNWLID